jgi:hypothetical protein
MREGLCSSNRGEDMGKEQGGTSSRTEQEVLSTAWPTHTCQYNCGTGHCYPYVGAYMHTLSQQWFLKHSSLKFTFL